MPDVCLSVCLSVSADARLGEESVGLICSAPNRKGAGAGEVMRARETGVLAVFLLATAVIPRLLLLLALARGGGGAVLLRAA